MRRALFMIAGTFCLLGSSVGGSAPDPREPRWTFDGVIRPTATLPLGIPVEGRLGVVFVERGDTIVAGQLLASLETDVEELDVMLAQARAAQNHEIESAEVRIEDARTSLEARESLGRIVAADEIRALRNQRRLAELDLIQAQERQTLAGLEVRRAEARLARRQIRSPFDGVVVDRHLSPGELVDGGQPVLTIAQVHPLRIETYLPVEYLGALQVGDTAIVLPDTSGEEVHIATVEIIDSIVDAASHTFGVRLTLPNPDGTITAGVRCRVRFER